MYKEYWNKTNTIVIFRIILSCHWSLFITYLSRRWVRDTAEGEAIFADVVPSLATITGRRTPKLFTVPTSRKPRMKRPTTTNHPYLTAIVGSFIIPIPIWTANRFYRPPFANAIISSIKLTFYERSHYNFVVLYIYQHMVLYVIYQRKHPGTQNCIGRVECGLYASLSSIIIIFPLL